MSYGLTLAHRRSSQAQQTFGTLQGFRPIYPTAKAAWRDGAL